MSFKRNIYLLVLLALSLWREGFSQINLVPDPGFEILDSCPSGYGQIANSMHWSIPKNGGGGNPELYNNCASIGTGVGIPFNNSIASGDYQLSHSGNGYSGIDVAYSGSILREYVQTKLIDTLASGKQYCVTFYANLANHCKAFIEPIGAYLDSGNVYSSTSFGIANGSPQVYNSGSQLSDTMNWVKIEGSFVASGIESYITIGNFFDDASSNIGLFGSPSGWASYYNLDDVSVIDISTPAFAGNDILINPGDSAYIGRPQEIGLNEDCIWSVAGLPIDTIAGMWVKPTATTTYVLEQSICGTVNYDTVTVSVVGTGIEETNSDETFVVFPNPSSGEIYLSTNNNTKLHNAEVWIYDITGSLVSKATLSSGNNRIAYDLQTGVYFVSVKDAKGLIGKPKKVTVIR